MNQTSFLGRIRSSQIFWPIAAWLIILGFNAIVMPDFFEIKVIDDPVYGRHFYGNLIDVFNNGAPLILVSIGMTLVIATGGVDLSVGAVIAISAAMGTVLINPALGNELIENRILTENTTRTPLPIIILADLAAGAVCGLWNGLLVSRARIQPMVATLILMVAGRGIAQLITNGQIMTVYYTPYFWFGNGYFLYLPVSIFIVAAVSIVAWFLVRKTSIGLFVESVGTNATSTFYSGINEQNVKLLAYTFCGICAAIAGLIFSSYVHSADGNNNGLYYELDAILAVVMGGTLMTGGRFSIFASVIGAVIIWTFTVTVYSLGVPGQALLAAKAVLVMLVILLYSDYSRRLISRLLERKGPRHETAS
jgi:ribose/xylose/arabinose/galactoside ABC-type transport system permease subunit